MKKLFLMLCVGSLMVGMLGCGKADDKGSSQSSSAAESSSVSQESTPASESTSAAESGSGNGAGEGHDYAAGWTEEMAAVREAVVAAVGEDNYWPSMPLTPDLLETSFGVTADMFEDYLAEMPMISAHVDTLVVVKAKEGQADAVEAALTAYRDSKVNDSLQYPMNIGKVQASRVEKIGDYVCFVQLGGDTTEASEQGDEAVITHCQEANELVIEVLSQKLQ